MIETVEFADSLPAVGGRSHCVIAAQVVYFLIAVLLLMTFHGCRYIPDASQVERHDENKPDYFDRKRQCMDIATRIFEHESKEFQNSRYIMLSPEYCYSPSLNTCLYAGGVSAKGYTNEWVRDGLTNKDIVHYILADGQLMSGIEKGQFQKRKAELMGTCSE